ncbi:MAG: hypothetical protein V1745_04265 [Patescibacteria group bacterium]
MTRDALLRTLAFHRTWGHAPTMPEWISTLDAGAGGMTGTPTIGDIGEGITSLGREGLVVQSDGRYAFASDGPASVARLRDRGIWAPRKRRAARKAARLLARLGSVRFIALCNTAALGHARDDGDLDLFVVARQGTAFATRLVAATVFEALGRRPKPGHGRDAVCLSYYVTDDGLDLASHMLPGRDPYFRYWFLSFVPLVDDGIGTALWDANAGITSRHPFARRWMVPPDLRVGIPRARLPIPRFLEPTASAISRRAFPGRIRRMMNADTRVMVSPTVLKFHVDDRREEYRETYEGFCRSMNISI